MSKKEVRIDFEYDCVEQLAICGSICVNPKKCIIHFKPWRTYKRKIKFLNMTAMPQIIRIKSPQPKNKIFKFPDLTTMTIRSNSSRNLEYTFMSYLNQEFKGYLHLENITDKENLAIELRAIPKNYSYLPRIIHFGNVDIGTNVTRKLHLKPESYPYQFRIFIPYPTDGLSVNPVCGEVFCDFPTEVTVIYKPQSFITLCTDLILYVSKYDQKPQVISLTAETKPKTKSISCLKPVERMPTKIHIPPIRKPAQSADKNENNIVLFNRHTLNKILMNKCDTTSIDSHVWLNPLGELEKVYRQCYTENCKHFMEKVKRFSNEHKVAIGSKISRCDPIITDQEMKYVIGKRDSEWDAYKKKLYSYQTISRDDQWKPLGFRERSIRMNYINKSAHDFDKISSSNWWIRFQIYNKFGNAVKIIIIKNRLLRRLNIFKALRINNIINTL